MKDFKISGVYKITNKINGKFYIGSSTNVFKRWKSHIERFDDKNGKEFNKPLYAAMRKFGLKNFTFEILIIEPNVKKLREKEKLLIEQSNAVEDGYNLDLKNQRHPNHKLNLDDVREIRTQRNCNKNLKDVYQEYKEKISFTGFCKVWKYETWNNVFTENKEKYKPNYSNPAETNPRAKLTNDEVKFIREQKALGKNRKEVYIKFSNKISFGSFENIWYGCNWKSLT